MRCKGEYDTVRTLPWTALNQTLEQKGQHMAAGILHIQLWTGRGECRMGRREKIMLTFGDPKQRRSASIVSGEQAEQRRSGCRRGGQVVRQGDDSQTCGRLFGFEVNCQRQRCTIQSLLDPQVHPPARTFARSGIRVATRTPFAQSEPQL